MRRIAAGACLAAVLAAVAGCPGSSGQTYPADPLFVNKKPVEAKAENAAPVPVVQLEPSVPAVPAMVVAATRRGDAVPGPAATAPRPSQHRAIVPTSHTQTAPAPQRAGKPASP
jgi:hypothetical protein